jgi:hypothetical protein
MEYTSRVRVTGAFVLLFILAGCGSGQTPDARKNNPNTDPFYIDEKGFDFNRFPLIKPYEVITLNHGTEWNLGLKDDIGFSHRVSNVKKLDVKSNLILAYGSDSTYLNNRKVYEVWYVINSSKQEEKGFLKEEEFLEYIKKHGIENPEWRDVNAVFKQFVDTYCLEWIPNCKK